MSIWFKKQFYAVIINYPNVIRIVLNVPLKKFKSIEMIVSWHSMTISKIQNFFWKIILLFFKHSFSFLKHLILALSWSILLICFEFSFPDSMDFWRQRRQSNPLFYAVIKRRKDNLSKMWKFKSVCMIIQIVIIFFVYFIMKQTKFYYQKKTLYQQNKIIKKIQIMIEKSFYWHKMGFFF